ncbi:MAG: hypothetical protein PHI97_32695 [Desulfobulbus sp.]|nr:hypothetical protein [Desulfobulbus sp.]
MDKNDYLHKEYELCFAQLRYYDDRNASTLQYLFTLTSGVATAQFAVYKFLGGPSVGFFGCQTFLSCVVFVATLLLYLIMLQNRLYFVSMARQLNSIRGYLMATEASEFRGNQLYTSTDFPALKPSSVHTFQLLGAALLSSLFAGSSAYSFNPAMGYEASVGTSLLTFVAVLAAEVVGGMKYLTSSKGRTADEVIHGRKREQERELDA